MSLVPKMIVHVIGTIVYSKLAILVFFKLVIVFLPGSTVIVDFLFIDLVYQVLYFDISNKQAKKEKYL